MSLKFYCISITAKLILIVLSLVFVFGWSIVSYTTRQLQQHMTELLAIEQSSTARLIAQDIEFRVRLRHSLLSMVAKEITPQLLAEPAQLTQLLNSHSYLGRLFQNGIFVISTDGKTSAKYIESHTHLIHPDQNDEIFKRVVEKSEFATWITALNHEDGKPSIGFAVPILGHGQQIIAALVGFSNPSETSMLGEIERTKISKTGWVTVSSPESGLTLSSSVDTPKTLSPISTNLANPPLDQPLPTTEGNGIVANIRGVEALTTGKIIQNLGWLVQVSVPTNELYAPIRSMKSNIYSLSAILSLGLALMIWLALKKSLAPLSNAAKRITAMSADTQAFEAFAVNTQDEVGQLLAGFNLLNERRRLADERAHRYAQINHALNHINQAVVRIESEPELFQTVCRIAVEYGGMKMAWVGEHDPHTQLIIPIASQGMGCEYLNGILISSRSDIPEGQGPTGTAFRENRAYLCQDFINDPSVSPWHEKARKFDWRASAVFPINRGGKPRYVVTLYSDLPHVFEKDVVDLLLEISGDIAFALDNFDREEQRHKATSALKENTLRLNQAIDLAKLATWEYNINSGMFTFNDRYYALHGTHVEREGGYQMSAQQFAEELVPPEESPTVEWEIKNAMATQDIHYNRHFFSRIQRRDGVIRHIVVNVGVIKDDAGNTVKLFGANQDITERKMHEDKLLLLGQITESAADGVNLVKASDGLIQYANQRFHEMFGYAAGELEGQHVSILNAPMENSALAVAATIMQSLETEGTWCGELANLKSDGTIFWTSASVSTFHHPEHGKLWITHQTDITERKLAEEQLQLSAKVFDSSTEAIIVTDASVNILSVNPAFTHITGYGFEEVVGKNPSLLNSGLHDYQFFADFWRNLEEKGCWQGEIWNRRKNGEIYPEWLSITTVRNSKGEASHYVAFFSDMSERKAAQQKIEFLSYHDSLTGLPNRQFANDQIYQAISHPQRSHSKFAVFVIGMDNFKSINDSLGHPVGDHILAEVATRLRETMRELDMICRLIGDEFLGILLDYHDSDEIIKVSEKLLELMARPYNVENQEISSSVSIGIAVFPNDGTDFETLLKNADLAMYRAKDAGRNTYLFFDESINTNAFEYLYLRNGLRRALENQDFVLYYQPQIDLTTGKLIGAEALLRWHDPELGLIPPNRFITVSEESGLIIPIGAWVLQEACRQAMEWQNAGLPQCLLGVNLSAVQFKRGDLPAIIKMALDKTGLDPACLELELTESILIRETESTLTKVRDLKLLGVKLAIDDFGTGYSSLSYLKRFNVDRIKIDKSFVLDITTDEGDTAIVQAIIQIAKSLSIKTIAEGVESQDIALKLQDMKCDAAQGFYYARPMPKGEFADYLSHYQTHQNLTQH